MAQAGSSKKVANGLVAVSAAVVLAVYAAGYERTQSAAEKLDAQSAERRPASPQGRGDAPVTDEPVSAVSTRTGDGSLPSPSSDAATRGVLSAPPPVASPEQKATASAQVKPAVSDVAAPPTQLADSIPPAERKPEVATSISTPPAATVPAVPAVAPTVPATPPPTVSILVPPAPQPPASPAAAAPKWKDGTYTGWGTCRHGDIQAEVVIEQGRIASARISGCFTRYSCSVIAKLPPEVIQRQSPDVDYVSGATQSADAFYYAVTDALNHAK